MVDAGSTPDPNSGLNFQLAVNHASGGQPVLVHDCYFSGNGNHMVYTVGWNTNGGVIWNCTFDSLFTFATGIEFEYINGAWNNTINHGDCRHQWNSQYLRGGLHVPKRLDCRNGFRG
jgi:hypothetical protein